MHSVLGPQGLGLQPDNSTENKLDKIFGSIH
jgi:hypothetical protein